jgi:hypothetical protein
MTKDYTKGKIYILRSNLGDKVYIGSTISTLADRFYHHKTSYRKWVLNGKPEKLGNPTCVLVFEEYGLENVYIELVELYPCSCKDELERREGQIQREYIAKQLAVNKIIAGRTKKEWSLENKDKLDKWFEEHKEDLKIKKKKYFEEHKDTILEYRKQYMIDHKEEISKKRSQKVKCECGCDVSRRNLAQHKKSKKHIELLKVKDI